MSLALLYGLTLAPGLTWAFDGADGGDLISAAATGGVPHPTGYPVYTFLLSGFLKIPFGSLAFRANLLSAVCAVLAAWMVYRVVIAAGESGFSAAIASLVFGASPLVWSQAIITEVYTLHAFLIAWLLYLLIVRKQGSFHDLLTGVIAGLAAGNHITSLFMLPLLLVFPMTGPDLEPKQTAILSRLPRAARRLGGLFLGLSVYLVILIRAQSQAPVNWGNAVDWQGLVWLVTGQMYQGRLLHFTMPYLVTGFQSWNKFLLEQFTILGVLLGCITLVGLFKRSRLTIATLWMVGVYSAFSILYYSPDSYVYLIPTVLAISIWIGIGSRWCVDWFSKRKPWLGKAILLVITAFFILRPILAAPGMSLRNDHKAEEFAQSILKFVPQNSLVITQGDEALFALWYFQFAEKQRPDIAVVSGDLLVQPWYRKVLRTTYPHLVVPDSPWTQSLILANQDRKICQTGMILKEIIQCR